MRQPKAAKFELGCLIPGVVSVLVMVAAFWLSVGWIAAHFDVKFW